MSIERSTHLASSRWHALAETRIAQGVGVLLFAVLTALSAKLALPVPGTAVPFTFQTVAVLLAGVLLGARLGAASQLLYLGAGLAGLPVFAAGVVLGPTGGYLIAFPLAAYLTGVVAGRSAWRLLSGMLLGLATIYAGGIAWLALLFNGTDAFSLGVLPFLGADLVKVVLALAVALVLRDRTRSTFNG